MSLDDVSKICIESFREAFQNILEGLQSGAKSVGPTMSSSGSLVKYVKQRFDCSILIIFFCRGLRKKSGA